MAKQKLNNPVKVFLWEQKFFLISDTNPKDFFNLSDNIGCHFTNGRHGFIVEGSKNTLIEATVAPIDSVCVSNQRLCFFELGQKNPWVIDLQLALVEKPLNTTPSVERPERKG